MASNPNNEFFYLKIILFLIIGSAFSLILFHPVCTVQVMKFIEERLDFMIFFP